MSAVPTRPFSLYSLDGEHRENLIDAPQSVDIMVLECVFYGILMCIFRKVLLTCSSWLLCGVSDQRFHRYRFNIKLCWDD